jgi:hypothetical protein
MNGSNFENEFLFVLGNGASIASAHPELSKHFKCNPSIQNVIPMLEEIKELEKKSPFTLSDLMDENHLEVLKEHIKKVGEISKRKIERDIVKLLKNLGEEGARNWSQQDDLQLQERTDRSIPIWTDISTLENAIYHLVAAYYYNYEGEYFEKRFLGYLEMERRGGSVTLPRVRGVPVMRVRI